MGRWLPGCGGGGGASNVIGRPPLSPQVADAKVLVVGAGGIGCELLKTLVMAGFRDIHVVRGRAGGRGRVVPARLPLLHPDALPSPPPTLPPPHTPRQVDLDTIDTSNLNRQFLFRKRHVGQSKAAVAAAAAAAMRAGVRVTPYQGNIKEARFGVDFFQSFDLVLDGLDNVDARRHTNRLCLAAGVPLVESGTQGFLGQVHSRSCAQAEGGGGGGWGGW